MIGDQNRPAVVSTLIISSLALTSFSPCIVRAQGVASELPRATRVTQLTEAETAGPLYWASDIRSVGDALWILDEGNDRIVAVGSDEGPREIGREGEGPGEFLSPEALYTNGVEAAVWDNNLRRLTTFSPGGEVLNTATIRIERPGLDAWVVYPAEPDGHLVLMNQSLVGRNRPTEPGVASSAYLLGVDSAMAVRDSVGAFPAFGALVVREERGGGRHSMHVYAPFADAVAHFDHTPACGGVFALSAGGRGLDVRFLDAGGRPIGRWHDPDATGDPVSDGAWNRYLARWNEEDRERIRRAIRKPSHHAAVQDLQLTSDGRIFLRADANEDDREWMRWEVRSLIRTEDDRVEVGEPAEIAFPSGFTPHEVRSDTVWGIHYDERRGSS